MIPGRQCTPVDGRRGRAFTATTAPRTRSTAAARSLERDSSASIRLSSLAWHPRPACSRLVPAGIGRMARASRGRVAGKSQAEATVIEGQPPLGRYRQVSSMLEEFRLAPRLGHCHDLQQVAVRVLEVETAPAPAGVDLAVGMAVWATAVGDPLGRHPGEDRLELRLADMERVVMALARPGVEARPAPQFWLVRKIKGQALVHLHLREVARARLDRQAEDLGEELGGGDLVFRWHDGMVQANRHCPPPDPVDPSPGDHSNCRSCDAWPAGERFISQQKRPGRPPSLVVRLCHEREGRHANDNARVILRHHDEVWTKGTLSAVDELGGRDPLAGWENVDTQNVDTSGLEGRLMLFMVIERFKNRDAKAVYRRFRDGGRGAPTGLTYVHSWIEGNFDRCFQIMECDDARLLQQWVTFWSDLIEFEIVPVVPSSETREAIESLL